MRTWPTILAALAVASCGGGGDSGGDAGGAPAVPAGIQLPAEFTLGHGETIHIELGVSLEFTTLVADSRCPLNATCVSEGNGRILLSTETPRVAEVHELNTSQQFTTRTNFDGDNYYVELRRLAPLPDAAGSGSVPVSAYEATVYVARITYHVPTGP
jgi:hypothetical protein